MWVQKLLANKFFSGCYVNYLQNNWANFMDVCEFAYNNSYHTAIKCSPFWALLGYHPRFHATLQNPNQPNNLVVPSVEDRVNRLKKIQEQLVIFHEQARQEMIRTSNKNRLPAPLMAVGERVWLNLKNIDSKRKCSKLDYKRQGPFTIVKQKSPLTYELELPPSMKLLHPVFHVNLLEPVVENTIPNRVIAPPPPIIVGTFKEFEVESIVSSRVWHGKVQYLVKWLGYNSLDNTYKDGANLSNAKRAITEFHHEHPSLPNMYTYRRKASTTPKGDVTAYSHDDKTKAATTANHGLKRKVHFQDEDLAKGGNARTRSQTLSNRS